MRPDVENNITFDRAVALREEGKYREATDLFLALARATDNIFDRAGMLLNVAHTLKASGNFDPAKKQLDAVRELLSLSPDAVLGNPDDEKLRGLLIGIQLEDARVSAAEDKQQEAIAKLNWILTNHGSELRKPSFSQIYQAVQRDRAFLLTDVGACQEALPILEEVDSTDPQDRWTLFYLGYCYFNLRRFMEAQQRLAEAIQLGLTPDFEGRARCALGASCYELGDYVRAKSELEKGVKTAGPKFIKKSGIWQWLEYTCISMGLTAEAEHYGRLARTS